MPLCFVSGIFLSQSNLINMFFHLPFPHHIRSTSFSYHFKIQHFITNPSQNMLIPSHSTSLDHSTKVSFKFSKLISSRVFLFEINLTPHIALIIAFLVLLKIAISFSLRYHVLLHTALPILCISDILFLSSLMKISSMKQFPTFSQFYPSNSRSYCHHCFTSSLPQLAFNLSLK